MIDLKDCHQNSLLCKFKTIYVSSQILIKKKLFLSRGAPSVQYAGCIKDVLGPAIVNVDFVLYFVGNVPYFIG